MLATIRCRILCFPVFYKNIKIKTEEIFCQMFFMGVKLGLSHSGRNIV